MKTFPTDPMRQNDRLIAAFCDDLFDLCVNGGTGTPRAGDPFLNRKNAA